MISSKVDVWSSGIIFFQMLYGRKPFADNQTQTAIYREQIIIKEASNLEFPATPKVSEEAKAFIRACLTYDKASRPDVAEISEHPYLKYTPPARTVVKK